MLDTFDEYSLYSSANNKQTDYSTIQCIMFRPLHVNISLENV